jgi:hypothetical protein
MEWHWLNKRRSKVRKLRPLIESHLGVDIADADCVTHEIKLFEQVDIQRVVDRWSAASETAAHAFGFTSEDGAADHGLAKHLVTGSLVQAPMERVQLECAPQRQLDCLSRGIILLRLGSHPIVLVFRPPPYSCELPVLEVIAPTRKIARETLSSLLEEAHRGSVYKGHTLTLARKNGQEGYAIRFQPLRRALREQLVLPDELIQVVERNVLGMLRHADTLRATGRSVRRGLLFHGPPGTGKTMMVRYLAEACTDHTVLVLSAAQQYLIQEACEAARSLAPTILILEDVDLIAQERERNPCSSWLHELLNQMDGVDEREQLTFLLTTNRPEVMEPALAARPGRVDQAVYFPLPDADCRRRLFEVYGRGLDLSPVDVPQWVSQTDGVSPAFIEELLRKAALAAAERGETRRPLQLQNEDIQNAIHELIYFGGELTQKLLGYRTGRFGFTALDGISRPSTVPHLVK